MGQRGEVFSTKFSTDERTYFFNVKENFRGEMYLNIVESKSSEDGKFIRQSIIVYPECLQEFIRQFQKSIDFMKLNSKDET